MYRFCRKGVEKVELSTNGLTRIFLGGKDDTGMSSSARDDFVMQARIIVAVVREDGILLSRCERDLVTVVSPPPPSLLCSQGFPASQTQCLSDKCMDILNRGRL